MSFEEAIAVLAIQVSAGEEGARRAYLRLVKVHKPDRDPEGFRRVREAYDRVKGEIAWRARLAGGLEEDEEEEAEEEAPSAAPEILPDPPPAAEPPVPDPVPPVAEPPTEGVRALPDIPLETLRILADPLHILERPREGLELHLGERSAEASIIVNEQPPAPDLELVERPPVVVSERPEIPADLHFAERAVEELRLMLRPDLHPEPEPDAPPPRPVPLMLMEQARARVDGGDFAGTADALAAFEEARLRPEAPEPDPLTALHLVLMLFAEGRPGPARQVFDALLAWFKATGAERRVMGGQSAARLAVARSLFDLPADTPEFPIRAIARATLDGVLEAAHGPLRTFAASNPWSAGVVAERFEKYAPLLANAFGSTLVTIKPAVTRPERKTSAWTAWFWVVLVLGVVRGIGTCGSSSPEVSYRQTYVPPRLVLPPPQLPPISLPSFQVPELILPPMEPLRMDPLKWREDALCAEPIAEKVEEFCILVREAGAAALGGDCPAVRETLKQMDKATASHRKLRPTDYRAFQRAVRQECRKPRVAVPPKPRVAPPPEPKQNEAIETSSEGP